MREVSEKLLKIRVGALKFDLLGGKVFVSKSNTFSDTLDFLDEVALNKLSKLGLELL